MCRQNHLGVYIRKESERKWRDIDRGLPSKFGFSIVVHPTDEDTAFVIPLAGDSLREPKDGRLPVFKTMNAGAKWQAPPTGLPYPSHTGVQSGALAADGLSLFGLFRHDERLFVRQLGEGNGWYTIATELPKIYSVSAA